MRAHAERYNVAFFVSVGDNFYPAGVASTSDAQWHSTFERVYTAPAFQRRWYIAGGNHDDYANLSAQVAYTTTSARWFFPHFYYADTLFSRGNASQSLHALVDLVVLDTQMLKSSAGDAAQLRWLADTLDASEAEFLVIVGHTGVFSSGTHGNSAPLQERVRPLLERHRASVYLAGHDHILQHAVARGEVHHVGAGTGCKQEAAGDVRQPETTFVASQHGFVLHRVRNGTMEMQFIDDSGTVLHTARALRRTLIRGSTVDELVD